jgi:cytochrome P450
MVELFGGSEVSAIENPYPIFERLRHEAPVVPIRTLAGHVTHLLTRYDDVFAALQDDSVFSNKSNARGISLVMGRTIIEMDGDEHLRHRKLIRPNFAPRVVRAEEFKTVVARVGDELVDAFAGRGRADLVAEFTYTFPIRVLSDLLGLPIEDYDTFHRWAIDLTQIGRDPERGLQGAQNLAEYLLPIVEQRRRVAEDDLITSLAQAEIEGHQLTDEEIISFLRLLIVAGAETTFHLIGTMMYALLGRPETLERVRADRTLLERVMAEALRWDSPIQLTTRETTAPVVISGVELPAGADILTGIGSANRDETRHMKPDEFDIDRKGPDHIAFGFGRHFCIGARLAHTEAIVAMNILLDRLPRVRFDPDAEQSGIVGLAFRGPQRLPVVFDA